MFQGTIYRIMIGCPSDIKEEVQMAKNAILKWTCMNAEVHNIVLLPLHWSDNSYPDYGKHPQKMLDRQLVDKSDMLVCIFGSKIGTATDTSESGSIEEIEEHVKAGKPVMLFFKGQGNLIEADLEQVKKIKEFRCRIQAKAMWCDYNDVGDFDKLFSDKLSLFINDHWLKSQFTIQQPESPSLEDKYSDFEKIVFSKWANNPADKQFTAHYVRSGLEVHFGYHNGYVFQRGEEFAEYEDFMERLCGDGLIKFYRVDEHGVKFYSITKQGYDFAHTLPLYDDDNNIISQK